MKTIDINCDMGELPEQIADGTQEELMASLTSVNIACGGHAGDASTMRDTIEQALRWKLAIGAHPGYPDRENFGRIEMNVSAEEIAEFVFSQVKILSDIAENCGAKLSHVKPHGALYNQAAHSGSTAGAIADGVARWRKGVVLVGLAGSQMLTIFREKGFPVAAEAFADRRYEADGSLRSRKFPDSLLHDPKEAAAQALTIVRDSKLIAADKSELHVNAQTLCIHSDTPGSVAIASQVAQTLREAGITLAGLSVSQTR